MYLNKEVYLLDTFEDEELSFELTGPHIIIGQHYYSEGGMFMVIRTIDNRIIQSQIATDSYDGLYFSWEEGMKMGEEYLIEKEGEYETNTTKG